MGGFTGLFLCLFLMVVALVSGQVPCNTTEPPCAEGEICSNSQCNEVVQCEADVVCSLSPADDVCRLGVCQPATCAWTGECATGYVCSQDDAVTDSMCVGPVTSPMEEGLPGSLTFPAPGDSYEDITWYKKNRSNIIAIFDTNGVRYGEEFCSNGVSWCVTSPKGELDSVTGDLSLFAAGLDDEALYYYNFASLVPDTGFDYEITLEVFVSPTSEGTEIQGVPDGYPPVGTVVNLSCVQPRMKPEAQDMYWEVAGVRVQNVTPSVVVNSDQTVSITIETTYTYAAEDTDALISCVVIPIYGDPVTVSKTINPGYGPVGSPLVVPGSQGIETGEKVTLTCSTDVMDPGNPPCDTYTWNKLQDTTGEEFPVEIEGVNLFEFMMEETAAGLYSCSCGNTFSPSGTSNSSELRFLEPGGADVDLILGVVVAVLIFCNVVLTVVVVILVIRRRSRSEAYRHDTGLSQDIPMEPPHKHIEPEIAAPGPAGPVGQGPPEVPAPLTVVRPRNERYSKEPSRRRTQRISNDGEEVYEELDDPRDDGHAYEQYEFPRDEAVYTNA